MSTATEGSRSKTPWWYWLIAAGFLFLGVMGVVQWIPYYTSDMARISVEDPVLSKIWTSAPVWAEAGYGIGILGMFIGSLGFALRRHWAVWFFGASAVGLLAHRAWLFLLSGLTGLLPGYAPVTLFLAALFDVLAILVMRYGARRGWVIGGPSA